jgi:predicted PurR-regulated permease PerM
VELRLLAQGAHRGGQGRLEERPLPARSRRDGVHPAARAILEQSGAPDAGAIASTIAGVTYGVLWMLAGVALVVFLGAFMAATPDLYRNGLLRLVPKPRRRRADEILGGIAHALRWWFLGQLVSMATLGVLTGFGLWLLDIPLWLALATLTAILTFVPYLGPILAAAPILLISFAQGLQDGLYVLALYVVVQMLEGNLITPLVQQRAVSLPPALTISSQIFFGALFGMLGFVLATPLVAALLVFVRMAYVEDTLNDRLDKPPLRG